MVWIICCVFQSRPDAWISVQSGSATYLDPISSTRIPLRGQQKVPLRTYVRTHRGCDSQLFYEASVVPLADEAYFFLEDMLPRGQHELVGALTRIEAEQLPASQDSARRTIGLTYGSLDLESNPSSDIPFLDQRKRTIQWCKINGRFDASVLTCRRLMVKFPALRFDARLLESLLDDYERWGMYGFLFDETSALLNVAKDETLRTLLKGRHALAEDYLRGRK